MSVIDSFSTLYFTFKITFLATTAPRVTLMDPFALMRRTQISYVFLPPRLDHARMYANRHTYNALLAFLEERELDWRSKNALTNGKRFVEGISKAFF